MRNAHTTREQFYAWRSEATTGAHDFAVSAPPEVQPIFQRYDLLIFRPIVAVDSLPDGAVVLVQFAVKGEARCAIRQLHRATAGAACLEPINPLDQSAVPDADQVDHAAALVEWRLHGTNEIYAWDFSKRMGKVGHHG